MNPYDAGKGTCDLNNSNRGLFILISIRITRSIMSVYTPETPVNIELYTRNKLKALMEIWICNGSRKFICSCVRRCGSWNHVVSWPTKIMAMVVCNGLGMFVARICLIWSEYMSKCYWLSPSQLWWSRWFGSWILVFAAYFRAFWWASPKFQTPNRPKP